jgi:hypothetical protein
VGKQKQGSLIRISLVEELIVMQELIFEDEAKIGSSACKPYLIVKLERTIIS